MKGFYLLENLAKKMVQLNLPHFPFSTYVYGNKGYEITTENLSFWLKICKNRSAFGAF